MKRFCGHHLIALATVALCVALPAHADPPPWAPAHGKRAKQEKHYQEREYRYLYYPAQQVYYSQEQQLWFWMNGGVWQFGVALPAQYHLRTSSGVMVTLDAARPYVMHAYVEEQYGRPWRDEQRVDRHATGERHKEKHQKSRGHD